MFRVFVLCVLGAAIAAAADAAVVHFKGYDFESCVIADHWRSFPEARKHGRPYLQVQEGTEYSIVIKNPLPVRVAVAVAIDGLNTIDGRRTTPDKAEKWIIEANSSLTLRGWQTGRTALRRFVFTGQNESYADWKERRDGKAYTANLGVIGVAYFWNRRELALALNPPRPFAFRSEEKQSMQDEAGAASSAPSPAAEPKPRAGTGMGGHEDNYVVDVEFNYDTGMYHNRQVLAIYYEFASNPPLQRPFLGDDDGQEFTPEMPD